MHTSLRDEKGKIRWTSEFFYVRGKVIIFSPSRRVVKRNRNMRFMNTTVMRKKSQKMKMHRACKFFSSHIKYFSRRLVSHAQALELCVQILFLTIVAGRRSMKTKTFVSREDDPLLTRVVSHAKIRTESAYMHYVLYARWSVFLAHNKDLVPSRVTSLRM